MYIRHISMMTALVDGIVNSLSILIMTSAWQPACLKKLTSKVTATAAARKQEEESDLSTLGGGS
jgi:hypothetical protein